MGTIKKYKAMEWNRGPKNNPMAIAFWFRQRYQNLIQEKQPPQKLRKPGVEEGN